MGLFGDYWVNEINVPTLPTSVDVTDWDKLYLGNFLSAWPGLCQVEPAVMLNTDTVHYTEPQTLESPVKQQTQKILIVDKGYEPAKIRATLAVWTRFQWIDLKSRISEVSPKTTNRLRPAYYINHPATDLLGIKQVLIDGIVVRPPEAQTLYVEIFMTEWFPYLVSKDVRQGAGDVADANAVAPSAGGNIVGG